MIKVPLTVPLAFSDARGIPKDVIVPEGEGGGGCGRRDSKVSSSASLGFPGYGSNVPGEGAGP